MMMTGYHNNSKDNHTMWCPPVISWFLNPIKPGTINHSYWSY